MRQCKVRSGTSKIPYLIERKPGAGPPELGGSEKKIKRETDNFLTIGTTGFKKLTKALKTCLLLELEKNMKSRFFKESIFLE